MARSSKKSNKSREAVEQVPGQLSLFNTDDYDSRLTDEPITPYDFETAHSLDELNAKSPIQKIDEYKERIRGAIKDYMGKNRQ